MTTEITILLLVAAAGFLGGQSRRMSGNIYMRQENLIGAIVK